MNARDRRIISKLMRKETNGLNLWICSVCNERGTNRKVMGEHVKLFHQGSEEWERVYQILDREDAVKRKVISDEVVEMFRDDNKDKK